MRCSALTWPMTGSTAARRFISRRMEAVTRRTWPEIQTLNRCGWVVAAVPFVDVNAASLHAGELLHVGDHGAASVPIEGIAIQCLGMEHELSALRGGHGGGDTDLAAELVRCAGFPLADALDLWRMCRIDLGAALMLILGAHPLRQIKQRAEASFQRRIAINLAADVADDPPKPRPQELELAPGAFELVGVGIAADHDGGALRQAQIALAQRHMIAPGEPDELGERLQHLALFGHVYAFERVEIGRVHGKKTDELLHAFVHRAVERRELFQVLTDQRLLLSVLLQNSLGYDKSEIVTGNANLATCA